MTEGAQLLVWIYKFLCIGICAVLYRIGGWKNKFYRRYLMPVVLLGIFYSITGFKHTFNYWWLYCLIYVVAFIGVLHIGYGADTIIDKLKKVGTRHFL